MRYDIAHGEVISSCGDSRRFAPNSSQGRVKSSINAISAEKLVRLIRVSHAPALIDVRTHGYFAAGHVREKAGEGGRARARQQDGADRLCGDEAGRSLSAEGEIRGGALRGRPNDPQHCEGE
jgi:hypothetical protein